MKGMLDFLEKAGLVRRDVPVEPDSALEQDNAGPDTVPEPVLPNTNVSTGTPLNFDQIYANAGIAPSLFPADRLLRLVDGLSSMDEATRLLAIRAMDAADDSWTIADPLADAAAKVKALAGYAEQIQLNVQALQRETQTRLEAVTARQAQVVGDIRKQITELEALVAREQARASQETAAQEARLKAGRDQAAHELAQVSEVSKRLQSLGAQFGQATTTPQE